MQRTFWVFHSPLGRHLLGLLYLRTVLDPGDRCKVIQCLGLPFRSSQSPVKHSGPDQPQSRCGGVYGRALPNGCR